MVGVLVNYPKGPIDLFHQDHSHELVGEGHLGEAEFVVSPR